jgi:pyruvate/2-oxoglutarate/acetoin dehydrogenase E1 component
LSPVPSTHIRRILDDTSARLSVYVEEGSVAYGWAAEILAQVQEQVGRDRPMRHERIGAADSPIPSSRDLERETLPQVQDIVTRVLECF